MAIITNVQCPETIIKPVKCMERQISIIFLDFIHYLCSVGSERMHLLGNNGIIVFHCLFRLKDSKIWMTGFMPQLKLPDKYVDGYYVEAVDCSKFHHNGIRYEGLQNLSGLNFLKWLSLKNNKHIDVWCLDRIAGQNGNTLEYLDITGMQLTAEAVFALSRMPALKVVRITDPGDNIDVQAALSILEGENSNLTIKAEFPEVNKTLLPEGAEPKKESF